MHTNMHRALTGVTVLDLTQFMAGPYCTLILAELGAEVIKVERPDGGDPVREWQRPDGNPQFGYINRGKQSVVLNYREPEGRTKFLALLAQADVLVENYRATSMDHAGLGWETLREKYPRLIYCSISGFGRDGPYHERGGFDLVAQAMGGLMHVTGEPEHPPQSVGVPVCDLSAGMWGALGIMAALRAREQTGRGQLVEVSLLEAAMALGSWSMAGFLHDGKEPQRLGARHRQSAPYQRLATADGHIIVGAATQSLWVRLCEALGHPELRDDPRFLTNHERIAHRDVLEQELERILRRAKSAHWQEKLEQAGVPCGAVNNYSSLLQDPHVQARKLVLNLPAGADGARPQRQLRLPLRLSESKVGVTQAAPALGEHTKQVLQRASHSTG